MDTGEAYERVRGGGGVVVPRPAGGLVRLTGPQRVWFLENTISASIETVPPGRWAESCFLTVKGKVLAHFRVGVGAEELWLDVDPPGTDELVDWFTRYRFRTKVEIERVARQRRCVLGHGALPGGSDAFEATDDAVSFSGALGEVTTLDVYGALPAAARQLPEAREDLYEILRIEAGLPAFGADYGPDTLPQEAGLTHVVSVDEGCYIGQEVMARLHFRGHVNRSVRPVRFPDAADADGLVGAELLSAGEKVGTVTSAVRSPARGVIGIGMVRVTVPEGAELTVGDTGRALVGPVPAGTKTASTR